MKLILELPWTMLPRRLSTAATTSVTTSVTSFKRLMSRGFKSRVASVRFTMLTTMVVSVSRYSQDYPSDARLTVAQPDNQLQLGFNICDGDVDLGHADFHTRIDGHERGDLRLEVDLCLQVVHDQPRLESALEGRKHESRWRTRSS